MSGAIHPLLQYALMAWCPVKAQEEPFFFYITNSIWNGTSIVRRESFHLSDSGSPYFDGYVFGDSPDLKRKWRERVNFYLFLFRDYLFSTFTLAFTFTFVKIRNIPWLFQRIRPIPRPCVTFRNELFSYGKESLAPRVLTRIWRSSPPSRTWGCAVTWWQVPT
jgi:hypothetical protein